MSSPIAALTADVHYNINTLPVADAAVRQVIAKANELNVPFVVAADLHDTKSNLRGECVKAMIETFKTCKTRAIVLIGNHCRINERSLEHSLEFLAPYAQIVNYPVFDSRLDSWLIPYYSDPEELQTVLAAIPKGSRLIMHQGCTDSNSGHYIQDKSALPKSAFADFRVISGHYHQRQDIKCGRPRKGAVGLFSYIGNPYTLNFAEAKDPEKGFQILMDDGLLQFVPLDLRKHVVLSIDISDTAVPKVEYFPNKYIQDRDLVWVKIKASRAALTMWNKELVRQRFLPSMDFKLDLIPTDGPVLEAKTERMTESEIMDAVVDATDESAEEKEYLKKTWRELLP